MEYRKLGQGALSVSDICLGTMTFGEQNDESEAHEQLDYAVSQGINFIDAAEMYPVPPRADTQGRTEQIVGTWLKKGRRDRVVVATKITSTGRGFGWVRGGPRVPSVRNGASSRRARPTVAASTMATSRRRASGIESVRSDRTSGCCRRRSPRPMQRPLLRVLARL